jgi:Family of unknown function (DUF5577)/SAM domain (Sterile alpha motif)
MLRPTRKDCPPVFVTEKAIRESELCLLVIIFLLFKALNDSLFVSLVLSATWTTFLIEAGIDKILAVSYGNIFFKNRIEFSMLASLNRAYLSQMSIEAVGDQIKILSHSKKVIAKDEQAILLKVVENKSTSDDGKLTNLLIEKIILFFFIAPRKVRRVHPEHEGKYTVTLPKGTTPKTRAILKAKMKEQEKKKSIFDRLSTTSISDVEISSSSDSIKKKTTSSIFNRLGNYNPAGDIDKKSITFLPPSSTVSYFKKSKDFE